jgi:hypothetical protein
MNIKMIEAIQEHPESSREWMLKMFEYTARRIRRNNQYKIWKDGYHSVELADTSMMEQRLDYIYNNSIEEEIVINLRP